MALKKLLGMETFPLKEEEIMSKIRDAYLKNQDELVFSCGDQKVKLSLTQLSPDGMMRGYQDYWAE